MSHGLLQESDQVTAEFGRVAIIGSGHTGCTVANLLGAFGVPFALIEKGQELFPAQSASVNNTGILHVALWIGNQQTVRDSLASTLGGLQMAPPWVLDKAEKGITFLLPNTDSNGSSNSAVSGLIEDKPYNEELIFTTGMDWVASQYQHAIDDGCPAVLGRPENLYTTINEAAFIKTLGGKNRSGKAWLGIQADQFDSGYSLNFPVYDLKKLREFDAHQVMHHLTFNEASKAFVGGHVLAVQENSALGFNVSLSTNPFPIRFHDVVNTAFTAAPFIPVYDQDGNPQPTTPGYIKFKTFVVGTLPEDKQDVGSFIQYRTAKDFLIRLNGKQVAVILNGEYDQGDLEFGQDKPLTQQEYWAWITKCKLDVEAKKDFAQEILNRVADNLGLEWIRSIGNPQLMMSPQLYPAERAGANLVEAAHRPTNGVQDLFKNTAGGVYFTTTPTKLTTIPLAATQAVLKILEPYIKAGEVPQALLDDHLMIKSNHIHVSEELQERLGCNLQSEDINSATLSIA